jgi:hypothetical protein
MAVEIRYAVARDSKGERMWWQVKEENFRSSWDTRKLFERKSSALAVLWRHRDIDHHDNYKHVLVKVVRKYPAPQETAKQQPSSIAKDAQKAWADRPEVIG